MNDNPDWTSLGHTDIQISWLGIGAWSWGDQFYWGYGRAYQQADVAAAYAASREAGVNFFDTAEAYGQGRSERLLGEFVRQDAAPREAVCIATKFMPFPWRLRRASLTRALQASLKRLGLERVDLYQVHIPLPPMPVENWADALADAVQAGLTRAVGVSNYSEEQMRRAFAVLKMRGVPLASNQVDYSLLNRKVEQNGVLRACQELGVTLIAYSPLAQGILSGKYTPENPPTGFRSQRYNRALLERVQPLIRLLHEIGRDHAGKTPSQVALNWCICKGSAPIPGAKNARQAQENAGALGWRLTAEEVARLDDASMAINTPQKPADKAAAA